MRTIVFDNKGDTIDRYSIWIEYEQDIWACYTMSENPHMFNQLSHTNANEILEYKSDVRVYIKNLNKNLQRAIKERQKECRD